MTGRTWDHHSLLFRGHPIHSTAAWYEGSRIAAPTEDDVDEQCHGCDEWGDDRFGGRRTLTLSEADLALAELVEREEARVARPRTPRAPLPRKPRGTVICIVNGCTEPATSRRLCARHYEYRNRRRAAP